MARERPGKGQSLLELPSTYISLDIETTGFSPTYDDIIEIAALKVVDNQVVDIYSSLVHPRRGVDESIIELTGITNEMLADAPTIETVLPEFLSFCGDGLILGHNVNFDINFLYDCCQRHMGVLFNNDFVDTVRLSRRLLPALPNHKLATLAAALDVSMNVQHHALADAEAVNQCFQALKNLEFSEQRLEESKKSKPERKRNATDTAQSVVEVTIKYDLGISKPSVTQAADEVAPEEPAPAPSPVSSPRAPVEYKKRESYAFGQARDTMSDAIAYLLITILFGVLGIHRFMAGNVVLGLVYLFTGGLCGIGWFIDIIGAVITVVRTAQAGT